jgi:hypothetical protein
MLKRIDGYWMRIAAPDYFFVAFDLDPLPPGTNAYANISLSEVGPFPGNPDPKFSADAWIRLDFL